MNSSCVATYLQDSYPTCQFWNVETMNGVLVARTDEDPLYGAEGRYDADYDPDSVGCGQ